MTAPSEGSGASGDPVPALGRIDASWRGEYIVAATREERDDIAAGIEVGEESRCVFCRILRAHSDGFASAEESLIVHRGVTCVAILNKYPYSSGHMMVIPIRHTGDLGDLSVEEHAELWALVRHGTGVIQRTYHADGINLGANLGRAAGAGIPGHLHVHIVPRWSGDTNFITVIGETRVVPEALEHTWAKLSSAW